jgi:hypothetical protein
MARATPNTEQVLHILNPRPLPTLFTLVADQTGKVEQSTSPAHGTFAGFSGGYEAAFRA